MLNLSIKQKIKELKERGERKELKVSCIIILISIIKTKEEFYMKKLVSMLLVVCMVGLLFAGCSSQGGTANQSDSKVNTGTETKEGNKADQNKTEEKQKVIAMVPKVIGSPYFDICAEGAKKAANELGFKLIYNGPTAADAAQQVNIIQDLIFQKVDAIAVSPNDPAAVAPILKKAKEAGIKVLTYDADADKEIRDIFVSQVSNETLGRHIMDNVAKGIGEKGQFAILTASLTASNQNTWIEWMKKQLAEKYPNIELVTIVPSEEDQQKAFAQTQNLVKAYPNLKAIAALSTVAEPGAAQAIEQMNMIGKIKLYGLATPNGMRQYLKSGAAESATLWDPGKLGYLTVQIAKEVLTGNEIKNDQEITNVGKIKYIPEEKIVIMGDPLDFTKDNVDNFDF
jgi:rhamnose ABC transporter rhamnose-binding protein